MTADAQRIPLGSQTVGPFFRIGLDYLIERTPVVAANGSAWVEVRGRVTDGDGFPVPDAMLEFWAAESVPQATEQASDEAPDGASNHDGIPVGFRRTATDSDGNFVVTLPRPTPLALADGSLQAPHLLVLVFARGLLRHLLSRMYFEDEPGNARDRVLQQLPTERRPTLIAVRENDQASFYRWNVVLQGQDETVFFAW